MYLYLYLLALGFQFIVITNFFYHYWHYHLLISFNNKKISVLNNNIKYNSHIINYYTLILTLMELKNIYPKINESHIQVGNRCMFPIPYYYLRVLEDYKYILSWDHNAPANYAS
jgi:hypothetical protein